jgi:NADH-quinone oxidoreductase subunit J
VIDTIVFLLAGAACVAGALGVVLARNPVHSALMLVMTLFGIAVLFVAQEAHFLAAVQVIVYAGAIVVLFLFVIMLLGVDRAQALELRAVRSQPVAAAIFALATIALLVGVGVATDNPATGTEALGGALDSADNVRLLAHNLFGQYVYAFELTSALLVIAVVGAVVLARRPRRELTAEIDDGADD